MFSLKDVVALRAATDRMRPVQKILTVAQCALGILVDRDDDRLHMVVTPGFPAGQMPYLREGVDPRRVILGVGVVPFGRRALPAPPTEDLGF
jgi:hypothetical protein